jgi:hypothetical protein
LKSNKLAWLCGVTAKEAKAGKRGKIACQEDSFFLGLPNWKDGYAFGAICFGQIRPCDVNMSEQLA